MYYVIKFKMMNTIPEKEEQTIINADDEFCAVRRFCANMYGKAFYVLSVNEYKEKHHGIFDSIVDLATDTVKIVAAPIDVAVTLTAAVVKPVAEVVTDLADDIKSITK